jgi:hypothetical protein
MTTIKCLSESGDFDLSSGDIELISDLDEVIQTSEQTIKQSKGELKYDKGKGISYFQNAFRDNFNEQLFKAEVRDQLLTVTNVQRVVIIDVSREGKELSYSATVATVFGKGEVRGLL